MCVLLRPLLPKARLPWEAEPSRGMRPLKGELALSTVVLARYAASVGLAPDAGNNIMQTIIMQTIVGFAPDAGKGAGFAPSAGC